MSPKTTEQLFETHKNLIPQAIWKNHVLLKALRLEDEDVAQQLSIAMLRAIGNFNPARSSSLATHIRYALQYEILTIKRRHKPCGITGVPKGGRVSFLYLDRLMPDGGMFELPYYDDLSAVLT